MTPQQMWLEPEVVTARRRRLGMVLALIGVAGVRPHYDGSPVVAITRDAGGVYVTGHPDAGAARRYLRRAAGEGRVGGYLDLERGGVQLVG